ncbi:MAG: NTP transferase domain-containing protein, partial [Candidatus Chisholmbacteria bacterium]|nr:NTP transferase domain-containing protein [Candidatus Chisholmbacteria bacterium]
MQVLILAGGVGRRFWPLTQSKYLYPFLGKTLIEHNLDKLKAAGFNPVIVASSPDSSAALEAISYPDLDLKIVIQKDADGMSGALLAAAPVITADPLLIINATDLVSSNLYKKVIDAAQKGQNALVGIHQDSYFPGGYYTIKGNQVVSVVEKPQPGTEPSQMVRLVFDVFQNPQAFIEAVRTKGGDPNTSYERTLDDFLKQETFTLITYDEYWQATKYPWHLLSVTDLLFKDLK